MIRMITLACLTAIIGVASPSIRAQDAAPAADITAIELPFVPTHVAMSADGTKVVVWNISSRPTDSQNLAVVDVESRKLVAQKIWPTQLFDVAVGEDVYVADEKAISRLSVDRLESQAVFETAAAGAFPNHQSGLRLMLVDSQKLSVGPRTRLALPGLTLMENYDHDVNETAGWLDGRCGFGWISEGVLWDSAMSKPLLLVWPYEFERNPYSFSNRAPYELTPAVGTWHPFPTRLSSHPGLSLLASATSPDIAATLGIIEDDNGFHLASFRLDNGNYIASVPIIVKDSKPDNEAGAPGNVRRPVRQQRSRNGKSPTVPNGIAAGGDFFAILLLDRLHIGPLKPLRGDPAAIPFHIVPRQSEFLLSTDEPTTVSYQATGATQFVLSSTKLGRDGKRFEAKSESGEFTLSIGDLLDTLVGAAAIVVTNQNEARNIHDNHGRAEFFAGPSRAAFQRLFGREAHGVPLPIDIEITAHGTDFETAVLRHDMLCEIPLEQFEDALDQRYPHDQNPWKKPQRVLDLTNYPATAAPPVGEDELTTWIQRLWTNPHSKLTGKELRDAALQAKKAGDARLHEQFVKSTSKQDDRVWSYTDGGKTIASLVRVFAGQVTLRSRIGGEFTVDDSKFSEADREFLNNAAERISPNDSDEWREFAISECVNRINRFHDRHGAYPPRAVTDDQGQSRLSWRVLLLRELGYIELFALFHFDEPWNSEHNRELIQFMPDAFALQSDLADKGQTTLLTISSPVSVLPTNGVSNSKTFSGEILATVIFAEAAPSRATEWTKPTDLELYEFTEPVSLVHSRDGKVLVGLLSGQTLLIPADTPPDDWRYAVNYGDGRVDPHAIGHPPDSQR